MSVKLSSLKKREVRRKIVFTDEMGVQEVITVKNPSEEDKETIVRFLGEKIDTAKEEFDIDPKDIMVNFLPLLTNIEVDEEDIDHIIANPSTQLVEVHYHIAEIIQEVLNEMLMAKSSQLSLASQHSVVSDIETKVEKISQNTPKKKGRPTKK